MLLFLNFSLRAAAFGLGIGPLRLEREYIFYRLTVDTENTLNIEIYIVSIVDLYGDAISSDYQRQLRTTW